LVLLVLLGLLLAGTGCSRMVAGSATAAPSASSPVATSSTTSGPAPRSAPPSTPAVRTTALESDVLPDECLLDAAQFTALLGRQVRPPQQSPVRRNDGSRSSSCYAGSVQGARTPLAAINVYRVRSGTPAEFVRAAGGRALAGAGAAAAVFDTAGGPTLQVASARFLVTLVVAGRDPGDDAWRAAAAAAVVRLPS
jgi:hypothetical protein